MAAAVVEPPGSPAERAPLRLARCRRCTLVQLADESPDEDDAGTGPPPTASATMAAHAERFVRELVAGGLAVPGTRVASVASHGGHLAPFLARAGVRAEVLEANEAWVQRLHADGHAVSHVDLDEGGGPEALADLTGRFDLVVDNYLINHLRAPRAGIAALAGLLAPDGVLVAEFDHLAAKLETLAFDAIRHGHRTYLTLTWLADALAEQGLTVVDATEHRVYGGAVRIVARRHGTPAATVQAIRDREARSGVAESEPLRRFGDAARAAARRTRRHLAAQAALGRRVAGYGAPARAVTFLNLAGITAHELPYVVDRASSKHGAEVAGTGIPIRDPAVLDVDRPDEILVLAWDLIDEVRAAFTHVAGWGGRFVVPLPRLAVVDDEGHHPLDVARP